MAETKIDPEQVDENITPKTNKEKFQERMALDHPDMDEEAQYGEHLNHMDEMGRASTAHKELNEKLNKYPKAALMLGDIMNGTHPAVAQNRYYDKGDLEIGEDDENYPAFIEAEKQRIADGEQSAKMQAEYEQNLLNSQDVIEKFSKDKGMSEDEFNDFIESALEFINDLLSGNLNENLLNNVWKIRNYESDIESSKEQGRVMERNTKIVAEKKSFKGDGLPPIKSVSTKITPQYQDRNVWGVK